MTMTQIELDKIIERHQHWRDRDCEKWVDMRADLRGADLTGAILNSANLMGADMRGVCLRGAHLIDANLSYIDLTDADLKCADLTGADLTGVNLRDADLQGANLYIANLYNANLQYASLVGANLYGAYLCCDLWCADLRGANLYAANLRGADLKDADLTGTSLFSMEEPYSEYQKGKLLTRDIIGYKKCRDNIIVTLLIPRGSIVFSINGKKCRTNHAKVIAIDGSDRAISKWRYMSYYVGDEITVYDFNCEYNKECAQGIHFFLTREEAENYRM